MTVWQFGEDMRYRCQKDRVVVKRGNEEIIKCRVEDLPHSENPRRHPKLSWADEHIKRIGMEAKLSPEAYFGYVGYVITLELFERGEPPRIC